METDFDKHYYGEPLPIQIDHFIEMADHFNPAAVAVFKLRGVEFAEQLAPLTDEQILRHRMVGKVFLKKLRAIIAAPPPKETTEDRLTKFILQNATVSARFLAARIIKEFKIE